jgi:hypothetical protein
MSMLEMKQVNPGEGGAAMSGTAWLISVLVIIAGLLCILVGFGRTKVAKGGGLALSWIVIGIGLIGGAIGQHAAISWLNTGSDLVVVLGVILLGVMTLTMRKSSAE